MQGNSKDLITFSGLFRTLLKTMTHEWNKQMNHNLSYTQFKVMFMLQSAELEKRKVSELADSIGLTPGAITGVVDKLLAEGYVNRERALDDRRVVYVEITAKGKELIAEVLETQGEMISQFFNVLPEEDIQHLRRIFTQMLANIEK
ncbi:MAG: MarR family winged helix-turn-helix transcriptional regulator [Candidatus Pristimantibacillus sp.]